MNLSKISVRYAKAIFLLAQEKNILDDVYQDFRFISKCLSEVEDFTDKISSPVVSSDEKYKLFDTVFKTSVNEITLRFLHLLVSKGREQYLSSISRNVEVFYRKEKNLKLVIVKTQAPVNDSTKDKIIEIISQKYNSQVEMINEIDSEMIGGLVIRIDNQQLDLSVLTQLRDIKKQLSNKAFQKKI